MPRWAASPSTCRRSSRPRRDASTSRAAAASGRADPGDRHHLAGSLRERVHAAHEGGGAVVSSLQITREAGSPASPSTARTSATPSTMPPATRSPRPSRPSKRYRDPRRDPDRSRDRVLRRRRSHHARQCAGAFEHRGKPDRHASAPHRAPRRLQQAGDRRAQWRRGRRRPRNGARLRHPYRRHQRRFGLTEAKIGSLPGSGGTQRLVGAVGRTFAAQMLFTGDLITAEQALTAGLVSELHAPGAPWTAPLRSPRSLPRMHRYRSSPSRRHCAPPPTCRSRPASSSSARSTARSRLTQDREEGRKAFREKRKPNFQGK